MSVRLLSLAESTAPLGLVINRRDPVIFRGTEVDGILGGYRAQFWRRPQDADLAGPALATANGTVSAGVASMVFTGLQMDLELVADDSYHDHFWLTITAARESDLARTVLREGWIEVVEAGFDGVAVAVSTTFWVVDDVAHFISGQEYAFSVIGTTTPPGAQDGTMLVIDDTFVITVGVDSWSTACMELPAVPPGAHEGMVVVIADMAVFVQAGTAYGLPAVRVL